MGMFLSACDTVREQTKSAILAIHHSGKNEASGLRGSSALLGGVDTSINCSHSGTVNLSVQKQKDTEQLEMISLEIEKRQLFADTSVTLQKLTFETGDKPVYQPVKMHVYNSEKFSDYNEAQESDDPFGEESPDVSSDLDFTFEDPE